MVRPDAAGATAADRAASQMASASPSDDPSSGPAAAPAGSGVVFDPRIAAGRPSLGASGIRFGSMAADADAPAAPPAAKPQTDAPAAGTAIIQPNFQELRLAKTVSGAPQQAPAAQPPRPMMYAAVTAPKPAAGNGAPGAPAPVRAHGHFRRISADPPRDPRSCSSPPSQRRRRFRACNRPRQRSSPTSNVRRHRRRQRLPHRRTAKLQRPRPHHLPKPKPPLNPLLPWSPTVIRGLPPLLLRRPLPSSCLLLPGPPRHRLLQRRLPSRLPPLRPLPRPRHQLATRNNTNDLRRRCRARRLLEMLGHSSPT